MRGQGSLEFLMLIGGGILIAVIIVGVLVALPQTASQGNNQAFATGQCIAFPEDQCNGQIITIDSMQFECFFDASANRCLAAPSNACDDDGTCEPANGENQVNCPTDCHCGNGVCQTALGENHKTCFADCPTYCGDGLIQTPNSDEVNEQCDQGNITNGDGCTSNCQEEPNYNCFGEPSTCCKITCKVGQSICWNSISQDCSGTCNGNVCQMSPGTS